MSTNVVIVPKEVGRRADGLINSGVPTSVIKGIELLLHENLHIDGGSGLPAINQLDCSALFKKGANSLQNVPFDLLGVEINCKTIDVRKAYKKLALKYHPDKNPKTTPLFQLIQAASTRLSDSDQRAKEAAAAAQKRGAAGIRQENRASAASFQSAFQKNQNNPPTNFPTAAGAKPAAAPNTSTANQNSANQGAQGTSARPNLNQQHYAYQQYQFKQQPQQQPQPQPSQYPPQGQPRPQQPAAPNAYGQPQASHNAQYQQYMNQQRNQQSQNQPQSTSSSQSSQPKRADGSMKGRNYYEELLKEQYKKAAAAEERAREYANRRFAEQKHKFGGPGYYEANGENTPFENKYRQQSQQQQQQPNLNPFRQANQYQGSVPTASVAGGNPVNVPTSYDWKYPSGDVQSNNNASGHASNAQFAGANNNNPTGGGTANTARTYRASADGGVHTQQSFPATAAAANPTNQRRLAVPKPYDFKFTSVISSAVELEWKTSQMHHCNIAVEFSWREKFPNYTNWEVVEKLIRAGCCRKKNLNPRACYEFRVRSVEELPNNQVGSRSDWSEILSIVMPNTEKTNQQTNNSKMPAVVPSATETASKAQSKTEIDPTPTPDMPDSYSRKVNPAAKLKSPTEQQKSPVNFETSRAEKPNDNGKDVPALSVQADLRKESAKVQDATKKNDLPTRPRTPTQERPTDEMVFRRFKSKSTLSKDDSGIFNPAQFQVDENELKPRSLDDSGPLQRKHTMQKNESSVLGGNSPVEKSLNKYFSKDKVMSSSQREAWGKQQQQNLQQQQPSKEKEAKRKRESFESLPTARVVDHSADDYSDDNFDQEVSDDEDVVRVDLDRPIGNSSISSLEDALLGTKKNSKDSKRTFNKKSSNDDEIAEDDDMLEESEYTDSDYSSVASHQVSGQQRKLRVRKQKNASSGRTSYPVSSSISKKLDAHGNAFDFFELDASYDHMDTEEIQYYQLHPPSIGNGMSNNTLSKKQSLSPVPKDGQLQVNYRHPVHAEPYPKSVIKGYIKTDRTIVGCAICGDWIRVKIQMAVYDASRGGSSGVDADPGSARKKAGQKAIWGWCLRTDGAHEFLRLIPTTRASLGGASSGMSGITSPPSKQQGLLMTPSSQRSHDNPPTSSSGKKMMSPPKESLQRGMTKASLGASAILNQSFFNLPKQTPTKEKLKKRKSQRCQSSYSTDCRDSLVEESEENEISLSKAGKSQSKKEAAAAYPTERRPPPDDKMREEEQVEIWIECYDSYGHVYYYNESSHMSKWELPEWVEEEDPGTGAKYYVHAVGYGDNITMTSTWTQPKKFSRLIRSQQYAS
jgi:curved DNA-binding protein CbpA